MFDNIKDTLNLLKYTFVLIGKNPEIIKPTTAQVKIALLPYALLVLSILSLVFGGFILGGFLLLMIPVFILFLALVFPFIKTYYNAAQCWIVYKTFTGKGATYADGIARAKENRSDTFWIGLFTIIFPALANRLKAGTGQRGGILVTVINGLMHLLGKTVEEGWDLIGNFLLPASIISENTVVDTLPEINNIRKNVPGALAGVFGIDFVGNVAMGYVWFILLIPFFILLFAMVAFQAGYLFIPLVLWIILSLGLAIAASIYIGMVKTIYFALLYVAVTRPRDIAPAYRSEVTGYLLSQRKKA